MSVGQRAVWIRTFTRLPVVAVFCCGVMAVPGLAGPWRGVSSAVAGAGGSGSSGMQKAVGGSAEPLATNSKSSAEAPESRRRSSFRRIPGRPRGFASSQQSLLRLCRRLS